MSEHASMALRQMEASWNQQQEANRILDEKEEHAWRSRYERPSCSDNAVITKTQSLLQTGKFQKRNSYT
jgi:hypothetical protein